jgi:hypothetical protein
VQLPSVSCALGRSGPADLLRRLLLLAFDFEDRFVCSACGKLLVLLPMRYGGLQCMQDGTLPKVALVVAQDGSFFRKPQLDVIAPLNTGHLPLSALDRR